MVTNEERFELVKELAKEKGIFPLQTIQSLSERWGVSRQNVAAWAQRHNNFPKPIEGIIEQTPGAPKLYPLYEVERYEKLRGLNKNEL